MLNAFLICGGHFRLDGVHDNLIGIHHLRGSRAEKLLNRESFFALPLVDTIMRTHFRLESVVQRLSGTGFLHTGNNAAAAVYLGVENSKGDDAATVAEVDRNLAAAGPLNVCLLYTSDAADD